MIIAIKIYCTKLNIVNIKYMIFKICLNLYR